MRGNVADDMRARQGFAEEVALELASEVCVATVSVAKGRKDISEKGTSRAAAGRLVYTSRSLVG